MKTTIVFLGLMATAFSLHIPQLKRPVYQNATSDIQLKSGMDQYIYCYDGPNCAGIRIQINIDPVPDLAQSPYYFDNRIVSCLYNGIYILYDGRNYNVDNLNGAVYAEAWGENNCVNMGQFSNMATSIRLTGVPNGWLFDSFNVYEGELYNGREQWAFDDAPGLTYDNFGKSMIITGCTPWTLYEYPNYGGQSACWYPADTQNCYPSFFRDQNAMKGWANQISSVRHGCYSDTKYYAEPISSSELQKLQSKGLLLENV